MLRLLDSSSAGRGYRFIVAIVLSGGIALWNGCSDEPSGPGQRTGNLEVIATTTGMDVDPDGYEVIVDGGTPRAIEANGTVLVQGVAAGNRTVELSEVSSNCTVAGSNPRTIDVTGGEIVRTTFQVACTAAVGSLVVTASTYGREPDPDGYSVSVDGAPAGAIGSDGAITIDDLDAGEHLVELDDLASACAVVGSHPRPIVITAGGSAAVAFDVICQTTLMDQIAFWTDRDGNQEVYVMNTDGSSPINLTNDPAVDSQPAVSPDGTRILFVSSRNGNGDVYVMNANGSNLVNLTAHPAGDDRPRWSPDGKKIAFTSDRDGGLNIFVMNADGSDPVILTNEQANAASWSPDGTKIAFTTNRTGDFEIFVMNADGSDPVNLTNDATRSDFAPAWSPDGTIIAYASDPIQGGGSLGPGEIMVMDADGSGAVNLTDDGADDTWPSWSPDGSKIAFASDRMGDWEVFVMNADGSAQTNVTNAQESADFAGFPQAWSP